MPPLEASGLQRELNQWFSPVSSEKISPSCPDYHCVIIKLFDILGNRGEVEAATGIEPVYTGFQ